MFIFIQKTRRTRRDGTVIKTYVTTLRDNTVECHQDATTWAPVSNVHPAFADVKITSSDFINVPFCIYFIVVPFNLKSSTAAFFQDDEAC